MQSQGVAVPTAQQLRFSKPKASKPFSTLPRKPVQGLLKDYHLKPTRPGWNPSFLTAFRIIILVRFFSAMYSNISDCDEVYNYWEPLHYLLRGIGFQTWEYSPVYAIRSYFYLLVNSLPGIVTNKYSDKRAAFFLLRLSFASVSSLVEALFYRAVVVHLSPHVGRYLLFGLTFSAGLWSSTTAFLPSTFALWAVLVSSAASLSPVEQSGWRRISFGLTALAIGAVVGWPFAIVLGVPMVLEQLFVRGSNVVKEGTTALWAAKRARALFIAALFASTTLIPVVLVDSMAYQKLTIVPWNIISYNLLSSTTSPTLYGVEGPSYYFKTGLLGFNLFFPLALLSLPALFITTLVDPKRFGDTRERVKGTTHPAVSVAIRLSPLYLWLGVLTLQAHKEERFLYPAYGLIVLNGSVTLYLVRGWIEMAYLKVTKSPWRTSQTPFFSHLTRSFIILTTLLSLFRIRALHTYYHAPLNVYHHLQTYELPRLALTHFPSLYPPISPLLPLSNFSLALDSMETQIDLSPLAAVGVTLCLGKEWHRFPSHFLVPDVVDVRFVRSEFAGIMPKLWAKEGAGILGRATATVPSGMNDLNRFEDEGRFVPVETCTYLVDVDFPHRFLLTPPPALEPRYAVDDAHWERVYCSPFLDNENSNQWTRLVSLPVPGWGKGNRWGDYCLLKRKG